MLPVTTVDRDTLRARATGDAGEGPYPWRGRGDPGAGTYLQEMPEGWAGGVRRFDTGACRDTDNGKIDPEGFLDPAVIRAFSEYMQRNRTLPDGSTRASDNWKAGFPLDVYMKSLWRHFLDVWTIHLGGETDATLTDALCGVLFNAQGYLHEVLKDDR